MLYLLAGGDWRRRKPLYQLLREILGEVGPAPRVAIVGTACEDDPGFCDEMARYFQANGAAAAALVPLFAPAADLEQARRQLAAADLIYLNGGDVDLGMQVLRQRGMVPVLDELFRQGKPFAGLSAGTMMLTRSWVRWQNPNDDASAELFPCLNFAPFLCDTHEEAEDWAEFRVHLALEAEGQIAYGLCSGSALRVAAGGELRILAGRVQRFVRRGAAFCPLPDLVTP